MAMVSWDDGESREGESSGWGGNGAGGSLFLTSPSPLRKVMALT